MPNTAIRLRRAPSKSRQMLANEGVGCLAQTFEREAITSQTLMTSQKLEVAKIGLQAGDQVSKIAFMVQTAASGLTLAKVCIYSGTSLVASSADLSGTLNGASNEFDASLSATYTVPTDGAYYIGLLAVGTTPPTLYRWSNVGVLIAGIGSGDRKYAAQTGQSDLPSTATWGAGTAAWWFAALP